MSPVACFVGPSLPDPAVKVPAHVRLLPPARCGDLLRARRGGFGAMALIDGLFEAAPTVWHKEILYLLGQGVPVLGAASLGAIRAAELDRYGMVGIGRVYALYRDGVLERDDAVMVSHAPAQLGYRPLTVALVDAQATIERAEIDERDRMVLLRVADRGSFRARTWANMLATFAGLRGQAGVDAVATAIRQAAISIKQRDATALLGALAAPIPPPPAIDPPPMTPFLASLLRGIENENGLDREPPAGAP